QPEQREAALGRGGVAPSLLGGRGRLERRVHVRRAGDRGLRVHLAGAGVGDVARLARGGGNVLAVDEVGQFLHAGRWVRGRRDGASWHGDPLILPSFPVVPTLAEIQIVHKGFRSR